MLLATAVWTILGLLAASRNIAMMAYFNRPVSAWNVLGRTMLDWYSCAVFTPVIFAVARRFRLDGPRWATSLPVHIAACVAFIVVRLALFLYLGAALGLVERPVEFVDEIYNDGFALLLVYASVAAAFYAIDYYERYRVLARVQLDALRAQLHPHFLFNALNALSTLVHRDPQAADRMIIELGELLRQSLSEERRAEVTLKEELQMVERYVAIMQIRYGDRLNVHYDVDAAAHDVFVPHMLLQPLVENALVHGIGRSAGDGNLFIRAKRAGERLLLEVEDDGAGIQGQPNERVGLRNTRALLEHLYARNQSLEVAARNGRGVVARVTVPWHREPVLR